MIVSLQLGSYERFFADSPPHAWVAAHAAVGEKPPSGAAPHRMDRQGIRRVARKGMAFPHRSSTACENGAHLIVALLFKPGMLFPGRILADPGRMCR